MAITTVQKAVTDEAGEAIQLFLTYPAEIIVNGVSTVSVSGVGAAATFTDSASGFTDLEVGDYIKWTGFSNDNNNKDWFITEKLSPAQIVCERRSDTFPSGVTEAAGAEVTMSRHSKNNAMTYGQITTSGNVAEIVGGRVWQKDHECWVFLEGLWETPLTYDDDILINVEASGLFYMDNGIANSTIENYPLRNHSIRKEADQPFLYDNTIIADGIPDAPLGVGEALDPLDDEDLMMHVDPALEGFSEDDQVTSLTNQVNSATINNYGGSAYNLYKSNVFNNGSGGLLNIAQAEGVGAWRQAFETNINGIGSNGRTFLFFTKAADASGTGVGNTQGNAISGGINNGGGFSNPQSRDAPWSNLTGGVVLMVRVQSDGTAWLYRNYSKYPTPATLTGTTIRFGNTGSGIDLLGYVGKFIAIDNFVDEDVAFRYVRHLLNYYQVTSWAPEFFVSSSGNDDNVGDEANPLATIGEAMGRCSYKCSQWVRIPDGERVNGTLPILNGGRYVALSHKHPIIISPTKTGETEPRAHCVAGKEFVILKKGLEGAQDMTLFGLCVRIPSKIPTDSVLRKPEDDAFNPSVTTSYELLSFIDVSSPSILADGVTDYSSIGFVHCYAIGLGLANIQTTDTAGVDISARFVRSMSAHQWGTGHTMTLFVNTSALFYNDHVLVPQGGWQEGGEASDIYSRYYYDQLYRPGSKFVRTLITAYDASSTIQMRSGGTVYRGAIVDSSAGCYISAPGGDWNTIILEGGYLAGSSQSINWGITLTHCQGGRIKNLLALPERSFYTQPFIMMVDNSTNNDHFGVFWGEIEQIGFLMDPPSSKVTIDNCTIAGRDGSAFKLRNVYNLDINHCAIKGCKNVFDFDDMSEEEISERNLSISNCVYDSLTSDFAIVGSDSKTVSEIEALMSGWTNVNEDTITFADDSRSFLQYAKDYLEDDNARVDHLLYVMIADAVDGIMTPELDIDYVFDYVKAGYEIVSLDAEDYGGIMPGITVGTLEVSVPTVTSPVSSSVTAESATLGGKVTSDGGAIVTDRGVVYSLTSTNNDPEIDGVGVTKVSTMGTTGEFTVGVTDLDADSEYSFKAYAINSEGTGYSSVATFTTLEISVDPATLSVTDSSNQELTSGQTSVLENIFIGSDHNYLLNLINKDVGTLIIGTTGFVLGGDASWVTDPLPTGINGLSQVPVVFSLDSSTEGAVTGTLSINSNSEDGIFTHTFVSEVLAPDFLVQDYTDGDTIDFGSVAYNKPKSEEISLLNLGSTGVMINIVADGDVSVGSYPSYINSEDAINVSVSLKTNSRGSKAGSITIFTNDPEVAEFNLSFIGEVEGGQTYYTRYSNTIDPSKVTKVTASTEKIKSTNGENSIPIVTSPTDNLNSKIEDRLLIERCFVINDGQFNSVTVTGVNYEVIKGSGDNAIGDTTTFFFKTPLDIEQDNR